MCVTNLNILSRCSVRIPCKKRKEEQILSKLPHSSQPHCAFFRKEGVTRGKLLAQAGFMYEVIRKRQGLLSAPSLSQIKYSCTSPTPYVPGAASYFNCEKKRNSKCYSLQRRHRARVLLMWESEIAGQSNCNTKDCGTSMGRVPTITGFKPKPNS